MNPDDVARRPGAFIIPFYGDQEHSVRYLGEALDGLFAQSDDNWRAIIVDDATPDASARSFLRDVERQYGQKVEVIWLPDQQGHGAARNLAVERAFQRGCPFILYNDADDISHPNRVEVVRSILLEHPAVGLVYSSYQPIDEDQRPVPREQMVPSQVDSLEQYDTNPIEGPEAWIRIGLDPGSACLPSSTAVRTRVAMACPSPLLTPSEDTYQWMHISAEGWEFKYTPLIPSRYRISSSVRPFTHHRKRIGLKAFYERTVEVRTAGFSNAIEISLRRGAITTVDVEPLMMKYYCRLADTMIKVGQPHLAERLLRDHVFTGYEAIQRHLSIAPESPS